MKISKIVKKVASISCMCLIALEILVIAVIVVSKMSGGVPSVLGYNMYVVASPSMSPELEIGDVVISKTYDGGELEVGDVVQFVSKSGESKGKIITHKIIWIGGENEDEIITKGVANAQADAPINRSDVMSVVKYKTVVIDKIYGALSSTWGFILLVMIPLAAMIVLEITSLSKDIKKEIKEAGHNDENKKD